MPGRLAQRLTSLDGVPTKLARAGVVVLMLVGASIGWAAGPDRDDPPSRSTDAVAIDRLSGELPISGGGEHPELAPAAALPRLVGVGGQRRAVAELPPEPTATPVASPEPGATPEPSATPDATVVPVATPAPAAPAPPPARPAPARPAPTPAPTFDSSG